MLRSVDWQLNADVSGQAIGSILKGKAVQLAVNRLVPSSYTCVYCRCLFNDVYLTVAEDTYTQLEG
jgi:hypothetical protein